MQNKSSSLCGLYCFFMAHYIAEATVANAFDERNPDKFINFDHINVLKSVEGTDIEQFVNSHCMRSFNYSVFSAC